ncbi:zinc finger MYM-type protein 1-like [Scyliorhinus torazame]|uniref:zinc finger MYM-type protein 1-like n=1 Tax=Scyliorhinus torazame TaxID=75743 RepID=UPI003B5B8128
MENHSSTTLFNKIQQVLGEHKLSVENIRGQSYDNASNMKGLEKGLQALFKNINRYADYVPCAAHSLNLVGEKVVSTVLEVVDYFGILQELYVFFSGSPRRWGILNTQGNLHFSLKSLSVTRWPAHYEAVRAIKNGYMGILQTLKHIFKDSEEKPEYKRIAKNLNHKLVKLEYAILTVVWEEVLERFNKISKKLQTPGCDVSEGYLLLSSLLSFVKELRENSADRIAHCESEAKGLCEDITSSYSDASKRIVTRKLSDGTSGIASLKGADKFRIEVLYQLYDCLIIQLRKRIDPYEQIAKRFKFLSDLVNNSEIDEDSIKLIISYYKNDIDRQIVNECYQFKEYMDLRKSQNTEENAPSKMQCADVLQLICEQHLIEVFPSITTALKLYLTMPITSCEAERNFSKLSFIKNKFRSTMTEERLDSLCILSPENDIARKLSLTKLYVNMLLEKTEKRVFCKMCFI